jgi:hypothetical protein
MDLSEKALCPRLVGEGLSRKLPMYLRKTGGLAEQRLEEGVLVFGWHFVATVDNDPLAMRRETSQLRL